MSTNSNKITISAGSETPGEVDADFDDDRYYRLRSGRARKENLETYLDIHTEHDDDAIVILDDDAKTASVKQPPNDYQPCIVVIPTRAWPQIATDLDRDVFEREVQYAENIHEAGHILYTPQPIVTECMRNADFHPQLRKLLFDLWNGAEDAAIEEFLRADKGDYVAERLSIKNNNVLVAAAHNRTAEQKANVTFSQALVRAAIDLGKCDTGVLRRLLHGSTDLADHDSVSFVDEMKTEEVPDDASEWGFRSDMDKEAFLGVLPTVADMMATVPTIRDHVARTRYIFDVLEDVDEYIRDVFDLQEIDDDARQEMNGDLGDDMDNNSGGAQRSGSQMPDTPSKQQMQQRQQQVMKAEVDTEDEDESEGETGSPNGDAETDEDSSDGQNGGAGEETNSDGDDTDSSSEESGGGDSDDEGEEGSDSATGGSNGSEDENGDDELTQRSLTDFGDDSSSAGDDEDEGSEGESTGDSTEETEEGDEESSQSGDDDTDEKGGDDDESDSAEGGESGEEDGEVEPAPSQPPSAGDDDYEPDDDFVEKARRQLGNERQEQENFEQSLTDELEQMAQAMSQNSSDNEGASGRSGVGAGSGNVDSLTYDTEQSGEFDTGRWSDAEDHSSTMGTLLERQLNNESESSIDRGRRTGRPDASRLSFVRTGNMNVMEQHIEGEEKDYSVVIVVDRSASTRGCIKQVEHAVAAYALALENIGIDVCIIDLYDDEARLISPFNVSTDRMKEQLMTGEARGGTPLHEPLKIARERLNLEFNNESFVLCVTDGKPRPQDKYLDELEKTNLPVIGLTLLFEHSQGNIPEKFASQEDYYDIHDFVHSPNELEERMEDQTYDIFF